LLRLLGMARQAGANRVRLQEAGSLSGMGIVASYAFSLSTGMLHFGLIDLLRLIAMAVDAELPRIGIGEDDFAVFRRCVAGVATLFGEWRMCEPGHQFGQRRLVWIVALRAIGRGKGLFPVGLDQRGVFDVMAADAKRGNGFGQVVVELLLALFANFVGRVATVASHVQSGVTAALFGNVEALSVAGEAKIVLLIAGHGFQQLILIVGSVRVMAFDAVADGGRMDRPFQRGRVLIGVAGDAERLRRRGRELYPGDVFIDSDLMAGQATHRDCGVDELSLRFILVAFQAFGRIDVLVQRNGVNGGGGARHQQRDQSKESQDTENRNADTILCDSPREPDAMGEQLHTTSGWCECTKVAVSQKNCCELRRARN